MFTDSDVLFVEFQYRDANRQHKSITRMPEGASTIRQGVCLGLAIDSEARVGREVDMKIMDMAGEEKVAALGEIITANHLEKARRGWLCIVQVSEVILESKAESYG